MFAGIPGFSAVYVKLIVVTKESDKNNENEVSYLSPAKPPRDPRRAGGVLQQRGGQRRGAGQLGPGAGASVALTESWGGG